MFPAAPASATASSERKWVPSEQITVRPILRPTWVSHTSHRAHSPDSVVVLLVLILTLSPAASPDSGTGNQINCHKTNSRAAWPVQPVHSNQVRLTLGGGGPQPHTCSPNIRCAGAHAPDFLLLQCLAPGSALKVNTHVTKRTTVGGGTSAHLPMNGPF
jgi:hypothetical protein